MKSELERILDAHFDDLRKLPNVLNVGIGKKFVNGKQTDTDCIVVFVSKKVPQTFLTVKTMVPKLVGNICTDVIELSSKDFKLVDTPISRKPFSVQRRLAGGVMKE